MVLMMGKVCTLSAKSQLGVIPISYLYKKYEATTGGRSRREVLHRQRKTLGKAADGDALQWISGFKCLLSLVFTALRTIRPPRGRLFPRVYLRDIISNSAFPFEAH